MAKTWDIRPPRKKTLAPKKKAPAKNSSPTNFWLYLLLIPILLFILWIGLSFQRQVESETPQVTPSASPTELKNKDQLKIKILNSTGRFEESSKVSAKLSSAGFPVSSIENTINHSNQTIIYYLSGDENYADEIGLILQTYNPQKMPFSQNLGYDLAVVIGG